MDPGLLNVFKSVFLLHLGVPFGGSTPHKRSNAENKRSKQTVTEDVQAAKHRAATEVLPAMTSVWRLLASPGSLFQSAFCPPYEAWTNFTTHILSAVYRSSDFYSKLLSLSTVGVTESDIPSIMTSDASLLVDSKNPNNLNDPNNLTSRVRDEKEESQRGSEKERVMAELSFLVCCLNGIYI